MAWDCSLLRRSCCITPSHSSCVLQRTRHSSCVTLAPLALAPQLCSIVSLGAVTATLPAAFFGMNLSSGLEELSGVFWPVVQVGNGAALFASQLCKGRRAQLQCWAGAAVRRRAVARGAGRCESGQRDNACGR